MHYFFLHPWTNQAINPCSVEEGGSTARLDFVQFLELRFKIKCNDRKRKKGVEVNWKGCGQMMSIRVSIPNEHKCIICFAALVCSLTYIMLTQKKLNVTNLQICFLWLKTSLKEPRKCWNKSPPEYLPWQACPDTMAFPQPDELDT